MALTSFENDSLLTAAGFVLYKECGCGGTLTWKFRKAGTRTEIWIKPRMGMFMKLQDSINVKSGKLAALPSAL